MYIQSLERALKEANPKADLAALKPTSLSHHQLDSGHASAHSDAESGCEVEPPRKRRKASGASTTNCHPRAGGECHGGSTSLKGVVPLFYLTGSGVRR